MKRIKKSNGELKSFSLASALNDIGSDMVRPFWPLFVTSILGAPVAFLGLLDGLGDAISQSVKFPAGYFSDRFKRRKIFIWLGYLLAGLARIGYALSQFFSWLVPFKIMDRMGKMRDPPRDAMLSNITRKKKRGKAFGILTAADNFGAFLGPIIAFFLIMYIGYREIFFLAAIPSLIGAVLIYGFVKEEKFLSKVKYRFQLCRLSANYKMLLFSSAVFSLSWFSISFMVLFASKYLDIVFLPLLFIAMSFFAMIASIPAGRLSDSIGRKPIMLLGYVLFAIVCLGFVFFNAAMALIMIFGLFILYGVHYGIVTTIQSPFISDMVPKKTRASAIGLYQTITGLVLLPASVIAGLLWDMVSVESVFMFGAVVSIIAAVLLFVLVREE
ncbi:MAG: MFS transporter [Candidatus Aenigmatarchaeota archaeon]